MTEAPPPGRGPVAGETRPARITGDTVLDDTAHDDVQPEETDRDGGDSAENGEAVTDTEPGARPAPQRTEPTDGRDEPSG